MTGARRDAIKRQQEQATTVTDAEKGHEPAAEMDLDAWFRRIGTSLTSEDYEAGIAAIAADRARARAEGYAAAQDLHGCQEALIEAVVEARTEGAREALQRLIGNARGLGMFTSAHIAWLQGNAEWVADRIGSVES